MRSCRYVGCKRGQHRFGLCNKHRKWVERGYMSEDLVMLKPIRERNKKGTECATPSCGRPVRRNDLCDRCSSRAAYVRTSDRASPGSVTNCKLCSKGGLIIKGFCKPHYGDFMKGFIDAEGAVLKQKQRVASYTGIACKVCDQQARIRGYCSKHYYNYLKGVPIRTVNKGNECKHCSKPAICRGLCSKHYSRLQRKMPMADNYVNKGKMCATWRCESPAITKGLCHKHYYRLKKGKDENTIQVRRACAGQARADEGLPTTGADVQPVREAIPMPRD